MVDVNLSTWLLQAACRHSWRTMFRSQLEQDSSNWAENGSASHQICKRVRRQSAQSCSPLQRLCGRCRYRWGRWGHFSVEKHPMLSPSSTRVHCLETLHHPLFLFAMCCQSSLRLEHNENSRCEMENYVEGQQQRNFLLKRSESIKWLFLFVHNIFPLKMKMDSSFLKSNSSCWLIF